MTTSSVRSVLSCIASLVVVLGFLNSSMVATAVVLGVAALKIRVYGGKPGQGCVNIWLRSRGSSTSSTSVLPASHLL